MPTSVLFIIASLIWGSTFWAITLQLGEVPPSVSVVYRFALASATLFAICMMRGHKLQLPWRTQKWLMLQGMAIFGLSYICTYQAEEVVVSGLVAVLFALMVFWTPLLGHLFHGTPIAPRTWSAGAAATCGVALLFYHSIATAWQDVQLGGSGKFLLGVVLALVATIASSAGSIVVGKIREQSGNVMLTTAWSMLWGTLLVALYTVLTGQRFVAPPTLTYTLGLIYLSLFGSVIAFLAYFTLINRIGPQKAVYIGVITPVLSVLLSIQLENYRPGPVEFLGMVLCLASVAWALRAPAAKPVQPTTLNNANNAIETP
jgi:drug/metabolite transporter (DMT)-like permease